MSETSQIMYIETILKTWCPKCDKVNYVNNGNVEDLTGVDVDGVRCWHCQHEYLLDDESKETPDAPWYRDGQERLE